ncbi:unnamed protein product [Parascedosporium putredinis]|uniref:Post-GPI attachment to proteins factor 3 n=1 Tax=Parascedosporium putredinis TaxID=1442378 RepID=A0A9P1H6G5_9PEZI|nr:unnamed protein product [Parascedosporium putredinis]CAI7998643.1 unnamed protein product [Parascedosporium putredinis]
MMSTSPKAWVWRPALVSALALLVLFLATGAEASTGDKLPAFRECVRRCVEDRCAPDSRRPIHIPAYRRLLLWDCPAECDYACQHVITGQRLATDQRVVQFYGKWPFIRALGMQEPLSLFAYAGIAAWIFSAVFHTRDFRFTEEMDYFAAGGSILYGFYYTPIRIFRLDRPTRKIKSILKAWTVLCCCMYVAHVAYLKGVRWDYTYNMAANVVIGLTQNLLWCWHAVRRYRQSKAPWTLLPVLVVSWITLAMSLELFDFAPLWGSLDAHALWHFGTIGPAMLWYKFLLYDALDDLGGSKTVLKD